MSQNLLRTPHLLGADLLGSGSAVPEPANSLGVSLGHPGGCPKDKVVYFNLFDNSGSMSGGNDPIGNRFEEVRIALAHLARHCRCGRELSCILHFDTPTSADVIPTRLDRRGLSALEDGLYIPSDGAGISLLGPSWKRATAMAARQPDYLPVVTILSDFELFDRPSVLDHLTSFDGVVHAVVFRSSPPQVLVDAPDVLVTSIQPSDPPGAVAQAVFESMTALRRTQRRRQRHGQKEALSW